MDKISCDRMPFLSICCTCSFCRQHSVYCYKESFEQALKSGSLEFHCNTCDTNWPPTHEEIAHFRREFAKHADTLVPHFYNPATKEILFSYHTYLVRTPKVVIVVDCGQGNDKKRGNPPVNMRKGPYLDNLKAAGVTPDQVSHDNAFGYMTIERVGNAWAFKSFRIDGSVMTSCTMGSGDKITCRPQGYLH